MLTNWNHQFSKHYFHQNNPKILSSLSSLLKHAPKLRKNWKWIESWQKLIWQPFMILFYFEYGTNFVFLPDYHKRQRSYIVHLLSTIVFLISEWTSYVIWSAPFPGSYCISALGVSASGGCVCPGCVHLPSCEQNSWHTLVKTLPFHHFCCRR